MLAVFAYPVACVAFSWVYPPAFERRRQLEFDPLFVLPVLLHRHFLDVPPDDWDWCEFA
jgi:hypothetical protein